MNFNIRPAKIVLAAWASLVVAAGCLGGSTTVTGEIKDDGITLATDHSGSNVKFRLTNIGTLPCDLIVVLASMAPDALPVKDGQVVIDDSGAPDTVRFPYGGGTTGYLQRIQPGDTFETEVALEGAPKTDERIVLCNGVGEYEQDRYALLRFDR